MSDREISMTCVTAYGCWVMSIGLLIASWITRSDDMGRAALMVCCVGATATIRGYLIELNTRIKAALIVAAEERDQVRSLR